MNFFRRPSRKITEQDAQVIIARLHLGEFQNRIAADFDVNSARISEVKTGKRFPNLPRPPSWALKKKKR